MVNWFSKGLNDWYGRNNRDLPWRNEKDPYRIWLSEIILQQTQVVQGLSYYLRFTEEFPTVQHLARASEDQVLKLWQGLGYYSRARNLHATAKIIVYEHEGNFPPNFPGLKSLKGIGDYTAAAIASFAFDLPHAVVDGNVYRILSRVFGLKTPIDTGAGKKEFQALANKLLNEKHPAQHNQAIMEFGSQYCKPVKPDCPNCIFKSHCIAFTSDSVEMLPVKSKKIRIKERYFNYIVLADKNNQIFVRKRDGNDIWKGLYEFNMLETSFQVAPSFVFESAPFKEMIKPNFTLLHTSRLYKHVLTHQHLHARFLVLSGSRNSDLSSESVDITKLSDLAFPRLIEKFLEDCDLKEIL